MNKKMVGKFLLLSAVCSLSAKDDKVLDIRWVDTFQAMRECEAGKKVGKELDKIREQFSTELKEEANKLAEEEKELKNKLPAMKKDVADRKQRELSQKQRKLQMDIEAKEEDLKITMQSKTEKLAVQVEESIVEVAKQEGADAVIDKMTGRMLYSKENNHADITAKTIAHINKKDTSKKTSAAA